MIYTHETAIWRHSVCDLSNAVGGPPPICKTGITYNFDLGCFEVRMIELYSIYAKQMLINVSRIRGLAMQRIIIYSSSRLLFILVLHYVLLPTICR
jgi:hypothetical protein